MHYVSHFDPASLTADPLYATHSTGHTRAVLIDRATGSMHTGLSIEQLEPGGLVRPHLHSFEEGFYILSGEAVLTLNGRAYHLSAGCYGAVKVGSAHSWQALDGAVRWLQIAAPQPKPTGAEPDTFFDRGPWVAAPGRVESAAADGSMLGRFDASMIPPVAERTSAAKGLEGVFLKWLLDENVGTVHHRMLFIEYQPGVSIGLHDHTFEEAYFILSGEVQGTLDGQVYRASAGDVLWTGVGCVHAFANVGTEPVRWLETFAPQPPRENVFRFVAEWDARARELGGSQ